MRKLAALPLLFLPYCVTVDERVPLDDPNFMKRFRGDRPECRKIKKGKVTYSDCGIIKTPGFERLGQ